MNTESIGYTFNIDNVKFTVDVDGSFFTAKDKDSGATPLRYHPKYELYFSSDSLTIRDEGGEQRLSYGIAVVPPLYRHRARKSSVYRLLFSFEIRGEDTEFSRFFRQSLPRDRVYLLERVKPAEMDIYFSELGYLLRTGTCVNSEIAVATLKLIFFHLFIFSVEINNRGSDTLADRSYTAIIEDTLSRYALDPSVRLDLDFMSKRLCLGKKQTARIVADSYKTSLSELVNEKRLSFALDLVTESELSMAQIAARSNFRSENYFFIRFKKAFGKTPLKYRKEYRGGTSA